MSINPTGWRCPGCNACYGPHVDECRRCAPGAVPTIPTPFLPQPYVVPFAPYEPFPYGWPLPVIYQGGSVTVPATEILWPWLRSAGTGTAPPVVTITTC